MSRIKTLELEILKNKELYYQGKQKISDFEYDKLEAELKKLDPNNIVLYTVGSQLVGNKVPHDNKMLSLQKTYVLDELIKWQDGFELISTEKIDGSSCSLIYKNGELIMAKTRGDGKFGENITSKVKLIPSVQDKISSSEDIEIRGEVYCTEVGFHSLVIEMEKLGLEKPNSMRNIVAGLLGRKENIQLNQYLNFKAFDYIGEDFETEVNKFKLLKKDKFDIPEYTLHKNQESIEESLRKAQRFMTDGDYLIDGVVFSYNNATVHSELGETAHHPRYKMAFKFQGEARDTLIEGITWQVSRNGILTPVAEIQTVEVSGANVSRVTLHNWGVVKDFNLKIGDRIEIERSGEVIPKFIKVIEKSDAEFIKPETCPGCDSVIVEEDIRLRCVNETCPEKNLESTKYFIKSIGIDDLSTERLREMYQQNLISNTADIFKLTSSDLIQKIEGFKEKLAEKIIKNIVNKSNVDLLNFLVALGINGGGRTKCEKIIDDGNYTSLDAILSLKTEQLTGLDGFAEKSASEFVKSLAEKKELIDSLLAAGVKIKDRKKIERGDTFSGENICITGALSRPRKEIQQYIKNNGGKVVSSVSTKTTLLICNELESSSSKYIRAKDLGIKIITEEALFSKEL